MEGLGTEANRVEGAETTPKIHDEYSDVFTGIGCFKGVDEIAEYCNNFIIVHKGPVLNDMFPNQTNTHCITIIDASSGYHNLKLNKNLHT